MKGFQITQRTPLFQMKKKLETVLLQKTTKQQIIYKKKTFSLYTQLHIKGIVDRSY